MELSVIIEALPPTAPEPFTNTISPFLQDIRYGRTHRIATIPDSVERLLEEAERAPKGYERGVRGREPERDRYKEVWVGFLSFVDPQHPLYSRATMQDIETEMRRMLVTFISDSAVQARLTPRIARNAIAALSGARTPAALDALEALFAFLRG